MQLNLRSYSSRPAVRRVVVAVAFVLVFVAGYYTSNHNLIVKSRSGVTIGGSSKSLDYASVDDVYKVIKKDFDGNLTQEKALDGLKEGLAKATGDPYTEYFNAKDSKAFQEQLNGSFEGIGAELGKDQGNIVIISPLSGYPAEKAGLKPKDIIIKIDDKPLTSESTISDAVKMIRGPKGTNVKLTVFRDGKQLDTTITRATINVPSVKWEVIEGNIGYIKISQFGDDTVNLAQKAAQELKDKGAKAILVDLRGNPGGYLSGAVDISSLWLKPGQEVVEERRSGKTMNTEQAKDTTVNLRGLPTVVLIDEGSASASEITAGALRDNGVAVLVGAKSFGKGSVQQIEQLDGGASIKITIARWFTPNGVNIDKSGIEPDFKVAFSDDDIAASRDPQKAKAIDLLKQKL